MTSALLRGSNLDKEIVKYMVLPEERKTQFKNKLTSPLFKEHFENENWQIIYFDKLRNAYIKHKANVDISSITGQTESNSEKKDKHIQQSLF